MNTITFLSDFALFLLFLSLSQSESFFYISIKLDQFKWATSKTWTQTLDPDPGPWTRTLDPGPWTLDPDPGPWTRTLDQTLKNLDPEKPGTWKTWNKYRIKKYVWL